MSSRILPTQVGQYKSPCKGVSINQRLTIDVEKSTTLLYCPEQEVYLVEHRLVGVVSSCHEPETEYFATLPRDRLEHWLRRKYNKGALIDITPSVYPYSPCLYHVNDAAVTNPGDFEGVIAKITELLHTPHHKESTS